MADRYKSEKMTVAYINFIEELLTYHSELQGGIRRETSDCPERKTHWGIRVWGTTSKLWGRPVIETRFYFFESENALEKFKGDLGFVAYLKHAINKESLFAILDPRFSK